MSERSRLHRAIADAANGIAPTDPAIALAALYVLRNEIVPNASAELSALVGPADAVLCAAYEAKEAPSDE